MKLIAVWPLGNRTTSCRCMANNAIMNMQQKGRTVVIGQHDKDSSIVDGPFRRAKVDSHAGTSSSEPTPHVPAAVEGLLLFVTPKRKLSKSCIELEVEFFHGEKAVRDREAWVVGKFKRMKKITRRN